MVQQKSLQAEQLKVGIGLTKIDIYGRNCGQNGEICATKEDV